MVLCALTALWAVPAKSAGRPQQDADSIAAMDSVAMDSIAIDSMAQTDSLKADSVPLRAYTILPDTTVQDSVAADTVKRSSSALDMPVTYSAQDSITFDYANMRATLFGDSKVNYQNLELTADRIDMSIDSQSRLLKHQSQHHIGRFATNSGQSNQLFHFARQFSAILLCEFH